MTLEPQHSPADEIANSVSHGLGLAASLVALPILVLSAAWRGDPAQIVGGAVFGAALVALYAASTVYHALPSSRAKRVFRVLDHSAIFVLIAGTYTPFTLGVLRGAWGWALLGAVWALAAAGIAFKAVLGIRWPRLSTSLYLGMGWLAIVAIRPMTLRIPGTGLAWIAAGGLFYTCGVVFYALDHRRYCHAVWHVFVLAGSVCHFFAVLWYAAAVRA